MAFSFSRVCVQNTVLNARLVILAFSVWVCCSVAHGQVVNPGFLDTTEIKVPGKLGINAYVEGYYATRFKPSYNGTIPYMVNHVQADAFGLNLAYVDVHYSSSRVRARFIPAFGSYMVANYASEPAGFRFLFEANAGVQLFRNANIWLDAGVLGSPITCETAVSADHMLLTRSLAAEYAPYYLTGARLSVPVGKQLTFYAYALNGWQNIAESNTGKALLLQVEARPSDKWLFNLNGYVGSETYDYPSGTPAPGPFPLPAPDIARNRLLLDAYCVYDPTGKFNFSAGAYMGWQQFQKGGSASSTGILGDYSRSWYNLNVMARYWFSEKWALAGRLERFSDPDGMVSSVQPGTTLSNARLYPALQTNSFTLGVTHKVTDYTQLRADLRYFMADKDQFVYDGTLERNQVLGVLGLAVKF